ncbi:MAG: hypothetical protein COV08_01605 [Candidatus Vogelbacteria bacterium CG10_big_fil_rev_8_21_14_0_10_49_38]|uniref:Type II toxin-antitoxin system mRNA interferase toxin, RelE/StbE family n=1 Tax=Candidatus Vogelbacteria bacterium CG10_big_fil_rev_8_21_14_0_10_49_38 TaxID=1975043 RepID=A0A2H0RJB2_9BACT|nr:MAG: hypothetical protein BK006_01620 [bacterium CG10_49_38]PIR46094.1 MAG: hypothetical protein COV08_01605 [Candidatus Vogelbacteria bacterium CG10_big_fil_rev_8_21_14_0_10_49_38]
MKIFYAPVFLRQFGKLEPDLQDEIVLKIESFRLGRDPQQLKIHKLKGKLSGHFSFSVNYRFRIVFVYRTKTEVILTSVGDHDVYK